jgi:2-acylglycerol O-acyltransferase 2
MYTQLGCVECTKPFMRDMLRRGRCLAVYPGGAGESRFARPGRYVCYVKNRKGFIRLALEERVDLLPLYTFGDEATIPMASWKDEDASSGALLGIQRFCKEVCGLLVPPLFAGLPRSDPLTTVVGVPVSFGDILPKEADGVITEEMVDKAHERYMQAQKSTFDKNKALVPGGHEHAEIEFV